MLGPKLGQVNENWEVVGVLALWLAISRRGYRFMAPVLENGSEAGTVEVAGTVHPAELEVKPAPLRPHGRHWFWVAGVGAVALVATLAIIGTRYSHRFGKR